MSSTTPSTPNAKPQRMSTNRSFTVPAKISTTSRNGPTAEIGAAEGIETLYVHPSANVIKFTTSGPWSRSSGSRPSTPNGGGTLPWASSTERTMAAGPLEIYRVPGSVSFLHSGALLHAILPRSQCWCVDGVSKFALRVLQDTYYRIELPGETPEDLEKVEEFKVTLAKVLFYERTPCPFARTFTVDLPEQPQERRSKRRTSHGPAKKWKLDRAYSWKPEDGGEPPRGASSGSDGAGSEEELDSRAIAERSDGEGSNASELADEVRDLGVSTPRRRRISPVRRSVTEPIQSPSVARIRTNFDTDGTVESSSSGATPARLDAARLRTFQQIPTDMPPSPPDSSAGMELPTTPSRVDGQEQIPAVDVESERLDDSRKAEPPEDNPPTEADPIQPQTQQSSTAPLNQQPDSAHSHPPLKPLPQPAHPNPPPPKEPHPKTPLKRIPSNPEDPFAAIQARILARRSIGGTTTSSITSTRTSPTTSSLSTSSTTTTTLTSRPSHHHHHPHQPLATALVRKACAAFLGPPAHLVAIMLRIAARFASGAFGTTGMGGWMVESPVVARRGGRGCGHRRVPGSFDLRGVDDDGDGEEGGGGWFRGVGGLGGEGKGEDGDGDGEEEQDWGEDDFGVPLRSPIRLVGFMEGERGIREREGRAWEVD